MKKRRILLAGVFAAFLILLSACSSGGNDVAKTYDQALNSMKKGEFAKAASDLEGISFYEDSIQLKQYCRAHAYAAEGNYAECLSLLNSLNSYRDSSQWYAYYRARETEETAGTPFSRAFAAKLYSQEILREFQDAFARAESIRSALYQEGTEAEGSEDWSKAVDIYSSLDNYKDSATRCAYANGRVFESQGEDTPMLFVRAIECYESGKNYADSKERSKNCLNSIYTKAKKLVDDGAFDDAEELYTALGDRCDEKKISELQKAKEDAQEAARQKRLAEAEALINDNKFDEAREIYLELEDSDKAADTLYKKAEALINENKFDKAREIYLALEDSDKAADTLYKKAEALINDNKFDEAREIYLALEDSDKAADTLYKKAIYLEQEKKIKDAAALYLSISGYLDSREKHYLLGVNLIETDPVTASTILMQDKDYKDTKEKLYAIADKASSEAQYPLSLSIFGELGTIKDCQLRRTNDLYLYGRQLLEGGKNEEAANVFDSLSGIGSAELYANMARYAAARKLEEDGDLDQAASAFAQIADYEDASERSLRCSYSYGLEEKKAGNYADAVSVFESLGEYKDSEAQEQDCKYLLAEQYENSGKWASAIACYDELGEYNESVSRRKACYNNLGEDQLKAGEAGAAYQSFLIGEDEGGQARAAYTIAEGLTAKVKLEDALEWYQKASALPETETRTTMIAQSLLNLDEDELSEKYASVVNGSERSREILYALAIRSLERQDEDAAMRQMKKAGDSTDASERFTEMLNARVETLVGDGKYDEAADLCLSYGDQERAEALLKQKAEKEEQERQKLAEANKAEHQARIEEANGLLDKEEYEAAAAIFTEIGETELAENALSLKLAAEEAERAAEEAEKRAKHQAREEEGNSLLAAGDYDGAIAVYLELEDQKLVNEAIYQKAAALNQPELYLNILEYKDSRELHYLAGKALLDSDPEKAYKILSDDISYQDTQAILYSLADRESTAGNYSLSSVIFAALSRQPLDPENPRPDCRMRSVQDTYQYGLALQAQGEWKLAADIFSNLNGFSQSNLHINEAYYAIAAELEKSGKYAQAALSFGALGDYEDAKARAVENQYLVGKERIEAADYANAEKTFAELANYKDSADLTKKCRYQQAVILFNEGSYASALKMFSSLGSYNDASAQANECVYQIAEQLLAQKEYSQAAEQYQTIEKYKDASTKLKMCYEALGDLKAKTAGDLLKKDDKENARKNYEEAYNDFKLAGTTEKVQSTALLIGSCYQTSNNLSKAAEWYKKAGDEGRYYLDGIAQYVIKTEQYDAAESILVGIDSEQSKEALYKLAERKLEAKDLKAALRLFDEAGDYSDASMRADEIRAQMIQVGSVVKFGHYEQDNVLSNGQEPIEWIVLAKDGNKALLLSRYGLDTEPYNGSYLDTTWEKCTLRTWLNGRFLNEAFTDQEQARIVMTNVGNGSRQGYSKWRTNGGNDTQDKVFLLSYAEANMYLGVTNDNIVNKHSAAAPTAYAIKHGANTSSNNKTADGETAGYWWLRSPGQFQSFAAYVYYTGSLHNINVSFGSVCVRPAVWINLESDIF